MLSTSIGVAVALSGGGSPFAIALTNRTVTDTETSPANALAGFRLGTDGKIYQAAQTGNSNYAEIAGVEWMDPENATEADNYECFATLDSGTLSAGTTGSWLDLAADQTWERSRTVDVAGTTSGVITIQIRLKGTADILATGQITLNGTVV